MVNVKRTHKKKRHYNRGKRINRAHNAMSGGVNYYNNNKGKIAKGGSDALALLFFLGNAVAEGGKAGYGAYLSAKKSSPTDVAKGIGKGAIGLGKGTYTGAKLLGKGTYTGAKLLGKGAKIVGKGIAETKFGQAVGKSFVGTGAKSLGSGAQRFGKFITTKNNGTKRKIGFRLGFRKSKQTAGSRKRLNKRNKRSKKISKRF